MRTLPFSSRGTPVSGNFGHCALKDTVDTTTNPINPNPAVITCFTVNPVTSRLYPNTTAFFPTFPTGVRSRR